jgi:RNA polymerase sigma-70 factor (ECF subfamily)
LQAVDWQLIVRKHGPAVWSTVYRVLGNDADAADCFQETFVCALEVSRHQRVRNPSGLLTRVATSRAINRLRQRIRQSHKMTAGSPNLADVPAENPGPLQQVQGRELAEKLRQAVARLPAQEAEVFCLRYLNGMSYRQIARELGIKPNAAGVLLHRARTRLRELLGRVVV